MANNDAERVAQAMTLMENLVCPPDFDIDRFNEAKRIQARIWRKDVSASMSNIEYYDPEATWIIDEVKRLLDPKT